MDAFDVVHVVDAMMMVDVVDRHDDNETDTDTDTDDIIVMDPSSSSIQERRHKRQKQKRTNRPPVCTFVNYLSGPSAPSATTTTTTTTTTTLSKSSTSSNASKTSVPETTPTTSLSTNVSDSNNNNDPLLLPTKTADNSKNDMMQGVVVCPSNDNTAPEHALRGPQSKPHNNYSPTTTKTTTTTTTTTKIESMIAARLSLKDDADSITSAETVNTSNKSVDIYLRNASFYQGPAVERWKKPPPPLPLPATKSTFFWGEDGWYVTSKCESDSEEEQEKEPAKPSEIIVRTRGRCPRFHSKWQSKGQKLKR